MSYWSIRMLIGGIAPAPPDILNHADAMFAAQVIRIIPGLIKGVCGMGAGGTLKESGGRGSSGNLNLCFVIRRSEVRGLFAFLHISFEMQTAPEAR